jgi:hypothetical protein
MPGIFNHLVVDHKFPHFKPEGKIIRLPISLPAKIGDLEKTKHAESTMPLGCSIYDICVIEFGQ